jgi:tRNA(Ile)-lysidine synthase
LAAPVDPDTQILPVMDLNLEMERCLGGNHPDRLGIAVSGGSDSTALLILLARWAETNGVKLLAATVDHSLRPDAKNEAKQVAELCADLNIPHQILVWTDWDHTGNLQDQARQARRNLLSQWGQEHHLDVIALGHTMNDQAETVLMRLMRGSGVDGLAGMSASRPQNGIRWIRPMLAVERRKLRVFLTANNTPWSEDPSNEDTKFERIKIRKLLTGLDISVQGLAETAARMQTARKFLEAQTHQLASDITNVTNAGDVEIDHKKFFQQPLDARQRLLSHCLKWVATATYRPRLEGLNRLLAALEKAEKSTLAGCVCEVTSGQIRISREFAAVKDQRVNVMQLWDSRWALSCAIEIKDCTIAALGEPGLAQCPDWRTTGLPRNSLLASPGIWQSGVLISAPIAGWPQNWVAELANGKNSFYSSILSH